MLHGNSAAAGKRLLSAGLHAAVAEASASNSYAQSDPVRRPGREVDAGSARAPAPPGSDMVISPRQVSQAFADIINKKSCWRDVIHALLRFTWDPIYVRVTERQRNLT
jgi:hypothetical protein